MTKEKILAELHPIFEAAFKRTGLSLEFSTTMDDIEEWDSLNHAILIDAIEKHYQIKFELMDMLGIHSVDDICDFILKK